MGIWRITGAVLDLTNDKGQDAVLFACSQGVESAAVDVLLKAWDSRGGYNWANCDRNEKTAFLNACASGNPKLVQYLLDKVPDLGNGDTRALYRLLSDTEQISQPEMAQLVCHPVVKELMMMGAAFRNKFRVTMALEKLAVEMNRIGVSPLLYKCFLRSIECDAKLLAEAVHEIYPSAIRALAIFVLGIHPINQASSVRLQIC